jgi:hypothetical protein
VDLLGAGFLGLVASLLLLLAAAIGLFVGGIWLGLRVLAPRLGRALDRAEEDAQERDRDD